MSKLLTAKGAQKALRILANPQKAQLLKRFFKTGKGEYAEGDVFIGVMVPQTRLVAKEYRALSLSETQKLIQSKVHEDRLLGLILLTLKYPKAEKKEKQQIFKLYLKNKRYINNWDLVDVTAPRVVGNHLFDKERGLLYRLAKSRSLWDRRIGIISTLAFIIRGDLTDTGKISKILLNDHHDLIHKAVGWMLREAGKREKKFLITFLEAHAATMPRTMLRYSIEKLSPAERKSYMQRGSKNRKSISH